MPNKQQRAKPDKPWPQFPLTVHPNGQFSKKIRGRVHYFGTWDDPQAAVEEYLKQKDYLHAGLAPPIEGETIADLLNQWHDVKKQALEAAEIGQETYDEYTATTDVIAACLGRGRNLESITPQDLLKLRKALGQGKTKQLGPVTQKRRLTIARIVFKYANEELGCSIRYRKPLASPPAKLLRKARNEAGKKLFEADQIRKIVKAASLEMKVVTLLGIACGYGPQDCCTLPISAIDLKGGWASYPRPKTEIPRKAWLWPECVAALKAVIGKRTTGRVLGAEWTRHKVADEMRKLVDSFYSKGVTSHYSLRRTFETIATTADVSQAVIDSIMGHTNQSMANIYRQTIFDSQLQKCGEHVRQWYLGKLKL